MTPETWKEFNQLRELRAKAAAVVVAWRAEGFTMLDTDKAIGDLETHLNDTEPRPVGEEPK